MKPDLRLYKYTGVGTLTRYSFMDKQFKFDNIEDVYKQIDAYRKQYPKLDTQFVIIEYANNYKSKIIEIVNK